MRRTLSLLLALLLLSGCRAGTAEQEVGQLRARASTLEAENAHLRGQVSLLESERDQVRSQVNSLATDLAKAQAAQGAQAGGLVAAGEHLVVVPREVRPGEWLAVYVQNYPVRLLPQAGVALRGDDQTNLAHVKKLAEANLFLLPVPRDVTQGSYRVVLGEAGALGPGARLDDQVSVVVRAR